MLCKHAMYAIKQTRKKIFAIHCCVWPSALYVCICVYLHDATHDWMCNGITDVMHASWTRSVWPPLLTRMQWCRRINLRWPLWRQTNKTILKRRIEGGRCWDTSRSISSLEKKPESKVETPLSFLSCFSRVRKERLDGRWRGEEGGKGGESRSPPIWRSNLNRSFRYAQSFTYQTNKKVRYLIRFRKGLLTATALPTECVAFSLGPCIPLLCANAIDYGVVYHTDQQYRHWTNRRCV